MRYALVMAMLIIPMAAFAQSAEGPQDPIPVQKCIQSHAGEDCSRVKDGSGFTASHGYDRTEVPPTVAPPQHAQAGSADPQPVLTR